MSQKRLIIIIAIAVIVLIFLPSLAKLEQLRYKDRLLSKKIKLLREYNNALLYEKDMIENDPYYLEKVARDQMGVTRQGEKGERLGGRIDDHDHHRIGKVGAFVSAPAVAEEQDGVALLASGIGRDREQRSASRGPRIGSRGQVGHRADG